MPGKTVVILGGGVGGLTVAKHLARLLPSEHRIVLVERNATHCFAPSLLWLVMGWRKPSSICREMRRLLPARVEVVQAAVESIDVKGGTVHAGGKAIGYDYLVVALGAALAYGATPNLFPAAHSFYELAQAERLRDALRAFGGGRVVLLIPSTPYKCPAAPYEMALLIDAHLRKRGLRLSSTVAIYTTEPQPMPAAGPMVGDQVKAMLEKREIGYFPKHRWTGIDPDKRELAFEDGAKVGYDLLVAIPPHQAPEVVKEAGLTDQRGWVPVDKGSLQTAHANVYALGDVAIIPLSYGLPLPKAGVFAHAQAMVVARNLAAEVRGGQKDVFNGQGACFLETGFGKAGFASGNFYEEPGPPKIRVRGPAWWWHWAKVRFERRWLAGKF